MKDTHSYSVQDVRDWLDCSKEAGGRVWEDSGLYRRVHSHVKKRFFGKAAGERRAEVGMGAHQFESLCAEVLHGFALRLKERRRMFYLSRQGLPRLKSLLPDGIFDEELKRLMDRRFNTREEFEDELPDSVRASKWLPTVTSAASLDFEDVASFEAFVRRSIRGRMTNELKKWSSYWRSHAPGVRVGRGMYEDSGEEDFYEIADEYEELEKEWLGERSLVKLNKEMEALIEGFSTWLDRPRLQNRSRNFQERFELLKGLAPCNRYRLSCLFVFLENRRDTEAYDEIKRFFKAHYGTTEKKLGTYRSDNVRIQEEWRKFIESTRGSKLYDVYLRVLHWQ